MSWTYCQRTGDLLFSGAFVGRGYSGKDDGKNNPDMQDIHGKGPIPCGKWSIVGPPFDSQTHGPYVLQLTPQDGTETFGRSGFLMHGDSQIDPGHASCGCIVVKRQLRATVWGSNDGQLEVVAEPFGEADITPPGGIEIPSSEGLT